MTKPRVLKIGDRVKITGPWLVKPTSILLKYSGGDKIGEFVTVVGFNMYPEMPIRIQTENSKTWNWCRENLRALPRKGNK